MENKCDEDYKRIGGEGRDACTDAPDDSTKDNDPVPDDIKFKSDYHTYGCTTPTDTEGESAKGKPCTSDSQCDGGNCRIRTMGVGTCETQKVEEVVCAAIKETEKSDKCVKWKLDHPDCPDCLPAEQQTWYQDIDGDGYYGLKLDACEKPSGEGWSQVRPAHGGGDCWDDPSLGPGGKAIAAATHPGAAESQSATACMKDADRNPNGVVVGDGHGDQDPPILA
ncbi:MAG: hypothetical protein ABEI97_02170, partial [Candidatus Nanohaloarchaea archaeon]